jgi:hypothetical protein
MSRNYSGTIVAVIVVLLKVAMYRDEKLASEGLRFLARNHSVKGFLLPICPFKCLEQIGASK